MIIGKFFLSKKSYKKCENKGFTLAEMLVVVAIIGILVAVSIQIFSVQKKKAEEATCAANRRTLLAAFRAAELNEPDGKANDWIATAAKSCDATSKNNIVYGLCPNDGYYMVTLYKDDTVDISCTKHTEGNAGYAGEISTKILQAISSITRKVGDGADQTLTEYFNKTGKEYQIDSEAGDVSVGGAESWTKIIGEKLNLSTEKMWMMKKSSVGGEGGYVLYMTTSDNKPSTAGETVDGITAYYYDSTGKITEVATGLSGTTVEKKNNDGSKYITLKVN